MLQSLLRTSAIETLYQASLFTLTSVPQRYSIASSQPSGVGKIVSGSTMISPVVLMRK